MNVHHQTERMLTHAAGACGPKGARTATVVLMLQPSKQAQSAIMHRPMQSRRGPVARQCMHQAGTGHEDMYAPQLRAAPRGLGVKTLPGKPSCGSEGDTGGVAVLQNAVQTTDCSAKQTSAAGGRQPIMRCSAEALPLQGLDQLRAAAPRMPAVLLEVLATLSRSTAPPGTSVTTAATRLLQRCPVYIRQAGSTPFGAN